MGGVRDLVAMLVICCFSFSAGYPVRASWFADRFSTESWFDALMQAKSQGIDTAWQRGSFFLPSSRDDILRSFDFWWCYFPYAGGPGASEHCLLQMEAKLAAKNISVGQYFVYSTQEDYTSGTSIFGCSALDFFVDSSRRYWILTLPQTNVSSSTHEVGTSMRCPQPGETTDVLFLHSGGIDPKELLLRTASRVDFSVYLGLPAFPYPPASPWSIDVSSMSAYFGWVERTLLDWREKYGYGDLSDKSGAGIGGERDQKWAGQSFPLKGVYHPSEIDLSIPASSSSYLTAYSSIKRMMTRLYPTLLFAVSPYVNANKMQVNATRTQCLDNHRQSMASLLSTGVDIVAVQEGRGVAKAAYFSKSQFDEKVKDVDPLLLTTLKYFRPGLKDDVTFADVYLASTRDLFALFRNIVDDHNARAGHGRQVSLWANLEAFEYTRSDPCLPLDFAGNGMAERLDRTYKYRIDWGLNMEGDLVDDIISFAWDYDYTCVTNNRKPSLHDEIMSDELRPIIAGVELVSDRCIAIRGFMWSDSTFVKVNGEKESTAPGKGSVVNHRIGKRGRTACFSRTLPPKFSVEMYTHVEGVGFFPSFQSYLFE